MCNLMMGTAPQRTGARIFFNPAQPSKAHKTLKILRSSETQGQALFGRSRTWYIGAEAENLCLRCIEMKTEYMSHSLNSLNGVI